MSRRYFGTDGVRGCVGEHPITAEFVLKLGWAAGKVLTKGRGGKVLIGKDTRISCYMFESALEAGFVAAGVDCLLLGPMPTPGVAYLTRTFRADVGVVISASHNPYQDNGIKFFSAQGMKLNDELEAEIEALLEQPMTTVPSADLGKVRRQSDATGRYIEFCKSTVANQLSLAGMTVVVDCAHGATYHVAPNVLRELGAEVIELATKPDGININKACGSIAPKAMASAVLEHGADLGIAFDGDGDRVIMADDKGDLVDGDELLFIMARYAKKTGVLQGGIVGTLMSNFGLELAMRDLKIPFMRSQVGDRYVLELLLQQGWKIGGETSGHIIHLGYATTGDAMIAALQIMSAMQTEGKTLRELKTGMSKLPQTLINVKLKPGSTPLESTLVKQAVQRIDKKLSGNGRVVLRPSGTEPLIRVMVEGEDAAVVNNLAQELAAVVEAVK